MAQITITIPDAAVTRFQQACQNMPNGWTAQIADPDWVLKPQTIPDPDFVGDPSDAPQIPNPAYDGETAPMIANPVTLNQFSQAHLKQLLKGFVEKIEANQDRIARQAALKAAELTV